MLIEISYLKLVVIIWEALLGYFIVGGLISIVFTNMTNLDVYRQIHLIIYWPVNIVLALFSYLRVLVFIYLLQEKVDEEK